MDATLCLIIILSYFSADCEGSNILVAFPVRDANTRLIMTVLSYALSSDGHQVMVIPPDNYNFNRSNVLEPPQLKVSADRGNVPNLFQISSEKYDKFESESIKLGSQRVRDVLDTEIGKKYYIPDVVIVPVRHVDVIKPILKLNSSAILIKVGTHGFDLWSDHSKQLFSSYTATGQASKYEPAVHWRLITYMKYLKNTWTRNSIDSHPCALSLIIDHASVTQPVPLLPSQVAVPGLHLVAKALSVEETEYMATVGSKGVVYFDLGEMVKWRHIPVTQRNILLTTLRELSLGVVWQHKGTLLDSSFGNVILKSSRPEMQSAFLAANNTKVFLSTCDLLTVQAGMWHGVPMLCMPATPLQRWMATVVEDKDLGITVNWQDLSQAKLVRAIEQLMTDRYQSAAGAVSTVLRDEPLTPRARAVWQVNYAIANAGNPHLRYTGDTVHPWAKLSVGVALVFLFYLSYNILYIIDIAKVSLRFPEKALIGLQSLIAVNLTVVLIASVTSLYL